MGSSPNSFFEKLFKPGFGYSNRYPDFAQKSKKFVSDITENTWSMRLPYETLSQRPLNYLKMRVQSKLKGGHSWPVINYHLCSGDQFVEQAKKYLLDLLTDGIDPGEFHTVVTHNMLEPCNPQNGFCFFDNINQSSLMVMLEIYT